MTPQLEPTTAITVIGPVLVRVFNHGARVDAVLPDGRIQKIYPRSEPELPVQRGPGRPFVSPFND
jgi:hypothetical protein